VESSNPAVLPVQGVVLQGAGLRKSISLFPLPDAFGTTSIKITVSDGTLSASTTFSVNVLPVNDAPSFAPLQKMEVVAGAGRFQLPITALSPGPANEGDQTLSIQIPTQPAGGDGPRVTGVSYDGAASAMAEFEAPANASAAESLTVIIFDSGGTLRGGANYAVARLPVKVISRLSHWLRGQFSPAELENPASGDRNFDWDQDGRNLLMEYSTGGSAKSKESTPLLSILGVASGTAPEFGVTSQVSGTPPLEIIFRVRVDDPHIAVVLEGTSDLQTWLPAHNAFPVISITDHRDGTETHRLRFTPTTSQETALQYFRLNVTYQDDY
jgi:hypothetical protein